MLDGLVESVQGMSRASGEAFRDTMFWCIGVPLWIIAGLLLVNLVVRLSRR